MSRILSTIFVLTLCTASLAAHAQQPVNTWSSAFAPPGVTDTVTSLVESDGRIYVGGLYYVAGSELTRFAAFDLAEEKWIALGDITGEGVYALAADNDGLIYVGGWFSAIGGIAASNIAQYDPQTDTWSTLGSGLNGNVNALAISASGDLYVGGSFGTAGGESVQNIARWDGEHWHTLEGDGVLGGVRALEFSGEILYVAGRFDSAGGIETKNVATYDTVTLMWAGLGGGVDNIGTSFASTLAVSEEGIFVGGSLNTAIQPDGSTIEVNKIARWDLIDEQWYALGEGSDVIESIGIGPDGMLYINGGISDAMNLGVLHRWDGNEWQGVIPVEAGYNVARVAETFLTLDNRLITGFWLTFLEGGVGPKLALYWYEPGTDRWGVYGGPDTNGMTDEVFALVSGTDSGTVYAGGHFRYSGTTETNQVAYWNGTSWEGLGGGVRLTNPMEWPRVNALHYGTDNLVYVGGDFHDVIQSDGTALPARRVAAWDPAAGTWHALGGGVNSYVQAITQLPDGTIYVGGQFTQATQAGGEALPVSRLVMWNTATGQWEAPPEEHGFTIVFALDADASGALFVAGLGSNGGRVARLDPHTQEWTELLSLGAGGIVNDLAVIGSPPEDGVLFVATNVGGGVWEWRNGSWSQLGGLQRAFSLTLNGDPQNGGELYAGGMPSEDPWHGVRRLRGTTWEELGEGILAPSVYALTVGPSETEGQAAVWAGGGFMGAGGMPSVSIARWETVNHGPSSTEIPPSEQGITLQVYPNPATDRITVEYDLPVTMDARLIVYDLLGRQVAVLHEGAVSGSETLSANVSGLSSGTYILRLADAEGRTYVIQRFTVVR